MRRSCVSSSSRRVAWRGIPVQARAQHRQRRLQAVRQVGQGVALAIQVLALALDEGIDAFGQRLQFARMALAHAAGLAALHAGQFVDHPPQRHAGSSAAPPPAAAAGRRRAAEVAPTARRGTCAPARPAPGRPRRRRSNTGTRRRGPRLASRPCPGRSGRPRLRCRRPGSSAAGRRSVPAAAPASAHAGSTGPSVESEPQRPFGSTTSAYSPLPGWVKRGSTGNSGAIRLPSRANSTLLAYDMA